MQMLIMQDVKIHVEVRLEVLSFWVISLWAGLQRSKWVLLEQWGAVKECWRSHTRGLNALAHAHGTNNTIFSPWNIHHKYISIYNNGWILNSLALSLTKSNRLLFIHYKELSNRFSVFRRLSVYSSLALWKGHLGGVQSKTMMVISATGKQTL